MKSLELRIPPMALVAIFAAIMYAISRFVPATLHIPGKLPLAALFMAIGALIALMGVIAFRRNHTTVNPFTPEQSSSLVSTGIYRFSRNPMYLGFLLALCGWCVYCDNWASTLTLPLFVAYMNRFQIQPEERALKQHFGKQFTDYTQVVGRWL